MPAPSIIAIAQPLAGTVQISVNFAAFPAAKYVRVQRVETNGATTPVRMNTAVDSTGLYMELNGGSAILYDCECPRDVSLYYVADAIDASGNAVTMTTQIFYDSFDAGPSNWTGLTNATVASSATHILSGSASGLITSVAAGATTLAHSHVSGMSGADNMTFNIWLFSTATLTAPNIGINWYDASNVFLSASTQSPLTALVANTWTQFTTMQQAPANTAFAAPFITWTAAAAGEQLWVDVSYFIDETDLIAATATSSEVILGSSGNLSLADPFNPANNVQIFLSPPSFVLPECVPGNGIFFAGMGDRNYGTQTTNWSVNNSDTPLSLAQVRAKPVASLQLILRTFADADALARLLASGNQLWMTVPAKYGYATSYITVGDLVLGRVARDFRRQWQLAGLPWVTVARSGGLMYGLLGTRWQDLCTPYTTIAAATAAGITWQQVLTGGASSIEPQLIFRTWQQVKTTFATWALVNNGTRTWQQLLAGQ